MGVWLERSLGFMNVYGWCPMQGDCGSAWRLTRVLQNARTKITLSGQHVYPSQKSEKPRIAAFPFGAIFQLVNIQYAYPNQISRQSYPYA